MLKAEDINKITAPTPRDVLKNIHLFAGQFTHSPKERAAIVVFGTLLARYIPFDNDPAAYYLGAHKVFRPSFQDTTPVNDIDKQIWTETMGNPALLKTVKDTLLLKIPKQFGTHFATFIKNMYERQLAN